MARQNRGGLRYRSAARDHASLKGRKLQVIASVQRQLLNRGGLHHLAHGSTRNIDLFGGSIHKHGFAYFAQGEGNIEFQLLGDADLYTSTNIATKAGRLRGKFIRTNGQQWEHEGTLSAGPDFASRAGALVSRGNPRAPHYGSCWICNDASNGAGSFLAIQECPA